MYENLVREYLTFFPCVAIIGARQSGKTTLSRQVCEGWKFYDLEREADYAEIRRDPDLFLRLNPSNTVIDEAQLLPALFPALRVAIDDNREHKGRFVITGSSSPDLLESISETLAGRVGIIEIGPLAFCETRGITQTLFARAFQADCAVEQIASFLDDEKATIDQVHDYWFRGGYPEPWLQNNERFQQAWMENYFSTYLMRDLSRLFPRLDKDKYRTFIGVLAGLSGSILNFSDIASALNVSQPTVKEYFSIAHGTFIWRTIPAFNKKSLRRITRHPKGHLRDSGLLHFLLRTGSLHQLLQHPMIGKSWEAVVIEEILRNLTAAGISFEYSYYRAHSGIEIDLIIEGNFGFVPVEIKHTQNVTGKHLLGIKRFMEEYACSFGLIINNDVRIRRITEKIVSVPFAFL